MSRGRLEMALAIVGEEPARAVERGVMADAGERVEEGPLVALGHARCIGGQERQAQVAAAPRSHSLRASSARRKWRCSSA